MINGKQVRMKKLFPHGKAVFLALDHGFSLGVLPGIESLGSVVNELSRTEVDALIINYGAFKNLDIESLPNCRVPFILHLTSGGTGDNAKNKSLIYKATDAVRMGADAVSVQLNLGTENELVQVEQAAALISECDSFGLPILLMMYNKANVGIESMVRMGTELGADMIKIDAGGDKALVEKVTSNSPIPILIAGGAATKFEGDFIKQAKEYMVAGATGISVGRNVFESHRPAEVMDALCRLVHHGK